MLQLPISSLWNPRQNTRKALSYNGINPYDDQRLRLLEVAKHAMAQHGGEASTIDRLVGVLAVGLHERHP